MPKPKPLDQEAEQLTIEAEERHLETTKPVIDLLENWRDVESWQAVVEKTKEVILSPSGGRAH